jgi:hypothetical protein
MSDTHYLGEFQSLSAVWKMFPNGAGYGDYITIGGVRYDWDESTNSWGEDPGDVNPALPEIVNHDIDVQGTVIARDGIKTADYIPDEAGAHIDHAGNAEFRTLKADTIRLQDPITGKLIPLAEFIKMFKTELPPDWSEYTQIPQFDDVRILAFDPISDEKFYTTIGALKQLIRDSIAAGGVGTGTFDIEILRTDDPDAIPTDNNVMSSLRTLIAIQAAIAPLTGRYLSRINPDTAQKLIKFAEGIEVGSFSSGMFTGKGGRIDERGNAEFEALRVRSLLEVPEIRYNRLTLIGEEIAVGGGGIIEDMWQDKDEEGVVIDPDVYVLKMKLEEGEMLPFFLHDIIKGIYNQAGAFRTSWFRVSNINHSEGTITVVMASNEAVPGGSNYPPMPFMNIARIGNFVDESRQSSIFISAKEGSIYMLDKVDNYMAGVRSFQLGKPAGLENVIDFNKFSQINQEQGYLYARGIMVRDIIEVDYLGAPVRPKRDRGIWSLETAKNEPYEFNDRRQDLVWVGWSRYLCIVDGTLEEPSEGATDWVMDLNIKDAFDESVADIYEGLDDLAGQINVTESNLGELTDAFNTLRDETLVAMEDGLISEAERRSLYAIYVRLDIEQEQLLSDVMYAINSIYMPPIYKDKLQSISDKFLSAGGSLDQYQASIEAILDHADPHITDYEREEYNRTLLIYSRDHTKLVNALRDSRLAIDAEIKRLANEKTEEVEGGKNLIRNYDQRWGWDFWGGDGISVDIDLDAITIVNQRGLIDDGNLIEDESGNIIEMV